MSGSLHWSWTLQCIQPPLTPKEWTHRTHRDSLLERLPQGQDYVATDTNFLLSCPFGFVFPSAQVPLTRLCLLVEFLTGYSTSFVSTAGSQRMSGALSSQGFSQPAGRGQRGRRRGRRCAVHLQKVPPAPTANQIPRQSQTRATRTWWWV